MLEVNNLHLSIGEDKLLNGVTFNVRFNQIVGISGAISSGKTSLLEAILNYIEFSNGTIIFENKKVAYNQAKHIRSLKQNIGYVPQKDYFLKTGTILENIQWIGKVSKDKAIEIATLVEMTDLLYLTVDKLSGYEKFRFKFALGMLKNPQILFIDEPFVNVKFSQIDELMTFIQKVSTTEQIGILIVSQYEPLFQNNQFSKTYKLLDGVLHGA